MVSGSYSIVYTYDATGVKLAKKVYHNGALQTMVAYNGELEFYDEKLKFIHTEEGMARYDETTQTFGYEYFLKDHLGNTRAVVSLGAHDSIIVSQSTDYYAFGMAHAPIAPNSDNKYLYNGKELQDDVIGGQRLDWLDYGARFYDPVIGRFHTKDRFAEKYLDFTPYQYGANNPIKFVDINGDSIVINLAKNSRDPKDNALKKAAKEIVAKQKDDNVFIVIGHANEEVMRYNEKDGSKTLIGTPEDLINKLSELSPEFKTSYENKEKMNILLLGCNTATEQNGVEPIAKRLADFDKNLTVTGISGIGTFTTVDGKEKTDVGRKGYHGLNRISGIYNDPITNRSIRLVKDEKLGLRTYQAGKAPQFVPFYLKQQLKK